MKGWIGSVNTTFFNVSSPPYKNSSEYNIKINNIVLIGFLHTSQTTNVPSFFLNVQIIANK